MGKTNYILLLLIFIPLCLKSQTQKCLASLLEYKYGDAEVYALKANEKKQLLYLVEILKTRQPQPLQFNSEKRSTSISHILDSLNKGYFLLFKDTKQINKSFELFNYSYSKSLETNNKELQKLSLIAIINSFNYSIVQSTEETEIYLIKLKKLIESPADEYHYLTNKIIYGLRNIQFKVNVEPQTITRLENVMSNFSKDHPFWAHFYSYVGSYYEGTNNLEKAKIYFENSMKNIEPTNSSKSLYFRGNIRLAEISRKENEFVSAIRYIDSAKKYINTKDSLRSLYYLKNYASEYYYLNDSYREAYEALKLSKKIGDQLLYKENAIEISNLNVKYQTAQKEKQILEEQALKKRNQNIALGLGGTLALGSIIGFLVYRNTKKKQRIAEQEKELEMQKTTTLLKEQEINTINAIIEGQEKERTRLASELHDNLGGTLAAVKMHIGNLQTNLQTTQYPEELLEKANTLISAAYKDVRNIAHARNSGVMAKDGLLPAVQKLARTLSNKDTLTIEVQDYGLTKRLNNDLEITIFRIIQELVTNIVKHANASQASISLTQHQEELSIIVEDNGVGFIAKKLEVKNGMGLGSIERRVEHLEGSMEVDSTPGRGTNILIDIPL